MQIFWYNSRIKTRCAYIGAVVVAVVVVVCAGAVVAGPIEECARIFESEIGDGVIHGAASTVAGRRVKTPLKPAYSTARQAGIGV